MPSLSAPQLALLHSQQQTSQWYCVPIPPVTVFSAQVNSGSITVGAVVIPYDGATGSFADVKKGMTVLVGSAPGLSDYGILRERLDADATNLYVAWNSDIAWADNLYLTVYEQFLAWSVRQRIVPPAIYKDYNIAYTDQTDKWPPIALMGDNVCKFFTGNPTNVTFPISGVAVAAGATITSYAIDFGDGSTSTSSGNVTHGYTAAGTYYATLTVTDSNGKTHLTRRIVCLPDPTTVYTVKFEGTSLEGAVDNGWTAKVRVFDPNADLSHFPERAPCFIISSDTYGGTSGGVGFPSGREEVVFFGYIVEDSVAVQPEYNEITFDLESIAGVMGRADSPPVYLGDSSNPAGEPDAWAWGKNLDVFRGLVFLLKFHSTVMDIADVSLYNDTTLTKAVDYPQDNLWNMLLQFAKGKRLMRASVTRTGTVVVGRDPNLVPIASRGAFTTVCTLVQGDWKDQVTIPQKPYPITSFICISGLVYDGNPAHEPNPVFGMSPGRPPKDYGAEREIQYLKLVDQTECNTLAGLILGTDNTPFGDIVIPMRGNWVKCFDPALQEYVQTPSGGWVTKRGTLLDSIKIIVRKVSVSFDWENGVMMPTLTCDYYSQPDIGVNGDCFPPDAPLPPSSVTTIPGGNPIIPPPPPGFTPSRALLLTAEKGVYSTTSFDVTMPHWTQLNTGLPITMTVMGEDFYEYKQLIVDSLAPSTRQFVHDGAKIYRRTSGGAWVLVQDSANWPSAFHFDQLDTPTFAFDDPPVDCGLGTLNGVALDSFTVHDDTLVIRDILPHPTQAGYYGVTFDITITCAYTLDYVTGGIHTYKSGSTDVRYILYLFSTNYLTAMQGVVVAGVAKAIIVVPTKIHSGWTLCFVAPIPLPYSTYGAPWNHPSVGQHAASGSMIPSGDVLYAACGECKPPNLGLVSTRNVLARSEDKGATWTNATFFSDGSNDCQYTNRPRNIFVIDPSNQNCIFRLNGGDTGSGQGIFRSIDKGVTWTELTPAITDSGNATQYHNLSWSPYGFTPVPGTNGVRTNRWYGFGGQVFAASPVDHTKFFYIFDFVESIITPETGVLTITKVNASGLCQSTDPDQPVYFGVRYDPANTSTLYAIATAPPYGTVSAGNLSEKCDIDPGTLLAPLPTAVVYVSTNGGSTWRPKNLVTDIPLNANGVLDFYVIR